MITPSFGLTATERVLPKLALDFTTATLDPRVTFTRSGNTATYINSSGVITAINADLPRFDYNPTTLVCQGLLIEEARTNIVLNSLIDGTILNTQIVTTSAIAYTLSFCGTGSIVLTGTHSATVAGIGAYPSRKTYTFTPTAGALTLTVSGTVQYAQLEAGSFATSFIPTSVASVTRNADVATMTGTNFSDWFNATQGAFSVTFNDPQSGIGGSYYPGVCAFSDNTNNNRMILYRNAGSNYSCAVTTSGVLQANLAASSISTNQRHSVVAYKLDSFAAAGEGGNVSTDNSGTVPTVNRFYIGCDATGNTQICGTIAKVFYYNQRLINAEVQAFSK